MLLWIAFRIVFLLGIRSLIGLDFLSLFVVNCFQNCIFTWHSQFFSLILFINTSCELLSELYFYLAFAVIKKKSVSSIELWIAFRIVFLLGIRSNKNFLMNFKSVVNCFQNCIFTWHSQWQQRKSNIFISCELLSELYFYLAFAVESSVSRTRCPLWIAFRIVFLLGIRSKNNYRIMSKTVVNCFQNCIFTWHSQYTHLNL